MKKDELAALFGALFIVWLYVWANHALSVYMGLPYYLEWDAWLQRFAVRSVFLRPSAFILCVLLSWRLGGLGRWGWHLERPSKSFRLAAAASAAFASLYLTRELAIHFSARQILIGAASAIPVALFEEACFRGLLFFSLRPRLGAFGAALGSSLIFTLYHTSAVNSWAMIFMFGFIACACVECGLGLPWLILLHSCVDAAWFPTGGDFTQGVAHPALYWGASGLLYLLSVRAVLLLSQVVRRA
jgi:membrane protease YdiL (CAAX protease family)